VEAEAVVLEMQRQALQAAVVLNKQCQPLPLSPIPMAEAVQKQQRLPLPSSPIPQMTTKKPVELEMQRQRRPLPSSPTKRQRLPSAPRL